VQVPTSVEPGLDFVVTATLIVADIKRSTAFYRDVLGATATPPQHPNDLSFFLNLRVNDIARFHERWRSSGATFITEPKKHASELRCYMRDPDGYLIEVGQTTVTAGPFDLYQ